MTNHGEKQAPYETYKAHMIEVVEGETYGSWPANKQQLTNSTAQNCTGEIVDLIQHKEQSAQRMRFQSHSKEMNEGLAAAWFEQSA